MAVDLTALQAKFDALTTQVSNTETVEASAKAALIGALNNQAQAIKDALAADDAAGQVGVDAIAAIVDPITARFVASAADLASAVPANTPAA
jgi:hypothetical protein